MLPGVVYLYGFVSDLSSPRWGSGWGICADFQVIHADVCYG